MKLLQGKVPRPVALAILLVLLALSTACGGNSQAPFAPSSPRPGDPALETNLTIVGPDDAMVAGGNAVTTGGTDAWPTVTPPPRLQKIRYLAFGDSITEGYQNGHVPRDNAYPAQLQDLLSDRYPQQTITVFNAGLGGETAAQGRNRLPGVLNLRHPEVLLLLEGYNNVRHASSLSIANDLRAMVLHAQSRGIAVLLATLTPISPRKEESQPGTRLRVQNVNTRIRALAAELGVPLVDLYAIMDGRWHLFTRDVHPNSAGYRVMAGAFFNKIVRFYGSGQGLSPTQLTDVEPDLFLPEFDGDAGGYLAAPSGMAGADQRISPSPVDGLIRAREGRSNSTGPEAR